VGHGAREAIEVFDVDATGARPTLTWRGCVPMPEGLAANSVASFADGSIVATVLFMPGTTFADAVVDRKPTGAVFEWSPGDTGFTLVEGTQLPANNGIEVSADGREIYVASSGLQTIVAFSRSNPARQLRTTRPLPFTPDNVHLGSDGRLLTAGMANDVPECGGAPGPEHDIPRLAACPRPTIAIAIDPRTMRDTVIATTDASPAFSNATMVLPVGNEAWIGTFSGNKIARAPMR
jgi:sugar lactone lactonase YvrE